MSDHETDSKIEAYLNVDENETFVKSRFTVNSNTTTPKQFHP